MPCTLTDSYTHTHTDTHRCRGKRATHGQTADFVLFVGVDFSLMELNGKAERWTLWRALFYFVFICGGNCYFSIRLFSLTKWWNAATTRRNNENFECTHTQKIWQLEISFFKRIFFFVIFLEFYNHIIFFSERACCARADWEQTVNICDCAPVKRWSLDDSSSTGGVTTLLHLLPKNSETLGNTHARNVNE